MKYDDFVFMLLLALSAIAVLLVMSQQISLASPASIRLCSYFERNQYSFPLSSLKYDS
jgi:hypothetical protein